MIMELLLVNLLLSSLLLLLLQLQLIYSIDFDYKTLSNKDFWLELAPDLHIYDSDFVQNTKILDIDSNNITTIKELIIEEGYVKFEPLFNNQYFNEMKVLINKLYELNLPIPFCYIYDEFWLLFMKLHNIIGSILDNDYYRLPDFWAWRIDSNSEQSGWNIHRDKSWDTIFNETGLPKSISIWIPLTDVDCTNSCMYIVPANRDPTYKTYEDLRESKYWPHILPNIRALPGKSGSVLIWNQAVWHWGSKTSSRVIEPRISVSVEFQSRKTLPYNKPISNPLLFPTYNDRISLIAKQILQYQHMYPLDESIKNLANEILEVIGSNLSKDEL